MATAPVRVADVGGWTDTWFAREGAVTNVAVGPGARVRVRLRTDDQVRIDAPQVASDSLLRHAVERHGGRGVDVEVTTAVPPGSSVGSSASVLVALVAALATGEHLPPDEVAQRAHHIETVVAGRESGVQDHVAAAHGGVSWIEVGPFPAWRRTALPVPPDLGERLVTVHLGGAHDSSALHRAVIARVTASSQEGVPAELTEQTELTELAELAVAARDRLVAGDLDGWGAVLTEASETQARLHPALVSDAARSVAATAMAHGAAGWKVNGAGGAGGSLTIVTPDDAPRRARLLAGLPSTATVLPLAPAPGVTVTAG